MTRRRNPVFRWLPCVGAVVAVLVLAGCGRQERAAQIEGQGSRAVVVSANYPLHYFARRIGGDAIEASFLVPSGVDPAYWEPQPEDIAAMQGADLILLNGAGYEAWLSKVSLPESRLLDTSAAFRDRFIEEDGGPIHQHGPGGEHSHGMTAFTTWLDLSLAQEQARAVGLGLATLLPEQEATIRRNLGSLTNDLALLDEQLRGWGRTIGDERLIGSHPVYQYLSRRYCLNLRSLHWEPDEVPDAQAWGELDQLLREFPARWMIWEAEPNPATAAQLRARGVESRVFAPCANRPATGDFLSVIQTNLARVRQLN